MRVRQRFHNGFVLLAIIGVVAPVLADTCFTTMPETCQVCIATYIQPGLALCSAASNGLYDCDQNACSNSECPCDGTINYLNGTRSMFVSTNTGGQFTYQRDGQVDCARVRPCSTDCANSFCTPVRNSQGNAIWNTWTCPTYSAQGTYCNVGG